MQGLEGYPLWLRLYGRLILGLPVRFQIWRNRRLFWRQLQLAASKDFDRYIHRAMASAELNRRLGDESLIRTIRDIFRLEGADDVA